MVKKDVGLVIGDEDDLEKSEKPCIAIFGYFCNREVQLVRHSVEGLHTVGKQDEAEDKVNK